MMYKEGPGGKIKKWKGLCKKSKDERKKDLLR